MGHSKWRNFLFMIVFNFNSAGHKAGCLPFFFKVAFLGQRSQTKISCVQPQLQLLQTAINMLQALITDSGDNFNKKFRKHKNIKRSLMKYKVALRNKIEKNS